MDPRTRAPVGSIVALLAVVASSGCHLGAPAERHPLASQPAGARMRVVVAEETVTGELIEVRPDTLLLLREEDRSLVAVPVARIEEGRVERGGPRGGIFRGTPSSGQLERWQPLSRYPQGVSATLMKQLLDAYDQEKVETAGS